jgi:hypothetical protein
MIQIMTFSASFLGMSKENRVAERTSDVVSDWVCAIMVLSTIYLPYAHIWDKKKKLQGFKKKWHSIELKIIAHEKLSESEIEGICDEILAFQPKSDVINMQIYRNKEKIFQELDAGSQEFSWFFRNNSKLEQKNFHVIPQSSDLETENHLLGYEKQKNGDTIKPSWFGNTEISSCLGQRIWESDTGHHIIMHPYANYTNKSDSSTLHVYLNIFRRLPTESEYLDLSKKIIALSLDIFSTTDKLSLIYIFFSYRTENEIIADVLWTPDGKLFFTVKNKKTTQHKFLKI